MYAALKQLRRPVEREQALATQHHVVMRVTIRAAVVVESLHGATAVPRFHYDVERVGQFGVACRADATALEIMGRAVTDQRRWIVPPTDLQLENLNSQDRHPCHTPSYSG